MYSAVYLNMKIAKLLASVALIFSINLLVLCVETRSIQETFHSDVIVTHWPTPATVDKGQVVDKEENQPGFMRKQLIKFGEVASKVGNAMGSHATKITAAIDKICEVIKTIIPLLAAVCHVGQFKFCAAATEGPTKLSEAMSANNLDLDVLD